MSSKRETNERRVLGFFGIGFDNQDGHERVTRSEHFCLLGGSEETHERMQDTAIRFTAELQRRGKQLEETPIEEVIEIFIESKE